MYKGVIDKYFEKHKKEQDFQKYKILLIDIEISKCFISFLYRNNAIKSYLKNLKKGYLFRLSNSYGFFIKTFIKKCFNMNPINLILFGFYWKKTKEGHKYWCELHIKWELEYKKFLIKNGRKRNPYRS